MRRYLRRTVGILFFVVVGVGVTSRPAALAAPLDYAGGTYSQNFDGLPTNVTNASQNFTFAPVNMPIDFSGNVNAVSGMDGWQLANPGGSSSTTEFKSQDGSAGSSAGRGVISLGVNGSSERSVGFVVTSNQVGRVGLLLKNTTASTTFTKFSISFAGEVWRRGDIAFSPGANDALNFEYGEGTDINTATTDGAITQLSFTGPMTTGYPLPAPTGTGVAVNGNDPANRTVLSGVLTGLDWAPGETLVLRWTGQDLTGQDDGLAIDDLTFRARAGTSLLRGDFNQDDLLSNQDLQGLLDAVANPDASKLANGISDPDLITFGDIDHSGVIDAGDVPAMLKLLAGSAQAPSVVPEPSSLVLATISGIALGLVARSRRRKLTA